MLENAKIFLSQFIPPMREAGLATIYNHIDKEYYNCDLNKNPKEFFIRLYERLLVGELNGFGLPIDSKIPVICFQLKDSYSLADKSFFISGPKEHLSKEYLEKNAGKNELKVRRAQNAYKKNEKISANLNILLYDIAAMKFLNMQKELAWTEAWTKDWLGYTGRKARVVGG